MKVVKKVISVFHDSIIFLKRKLLKK